LVDKKLELVFLDKDGKWYPLDEVSREELAEGLENSQRKLPRDCN